MKSKYVNRAIVPPQECTGCALCANVCGKDAVRMEWNREGFLVPQVDYSACVNCGACVKSCPAQSEQLTALRSESNDLLTEHIIAFACWNANRETQLISSSGGIFSALAEHIFAQRGCVFGVIWKNKDTATYAKAENMDEFSPMRGSKYTQAITGNVYREVKNELDKGRLVLFSGTSCLIYALKRYLKKNYDNLLLVDILCHGVPSRNLLLSYISEHEKQQRKKLAYLQFRDKAGNWQQYQVKKIFTDGSFLTHCHREDSFILIFTRDYVLNAACYNCPHARLPRVGDMSLGDFWGDLRKLHPEWPISDGIGSLICNTQKGLRYFHELQEKRKIISYTVPFSELYEGQPKTYLRKNEIPTTLRSYILKKLSRKPISVVYSLLFDQEQCGPFKLIRGSILHKCYITIRKLKHWFIKLFKCQNNRRTSD